MSTSPRNERRWSGARAAAAEAAAIVGISLAVVWLFSGVPFNNDSYAYYLNLVAVRSPLNALDPSTRLLDLAPLGWRYLPLRSYAYVGSLSSLLYLPLYLLWPSPHSARLMGLLMLGIQAAIFSRLFGLRARSCFAVLLLCMPYSFQHIVDTGPTAYPITIMCLIVLLARGWFRSLGKGGARGALYPAAIAALVFLGLWCKLSFVYYLPVIALFALHYAVENRGSLAGVAPRRRFLLHCIVLLYMCGIPTAVLLGAKMRPPAEGRYYQCATGVVDEALGELPYAYTPWRQFLYLSNRFTNPLQAAHFVYRIPRAATLSGVALCAVTVLLLGYGIVRLRGRERIIRFIATGLLSSGMVLAALLANPAAFCMHHVVLAYPFALMAVFAVLSGLRGDRTARVLLAAFLALNGYQFCKMRGLDYREWEKAHHRHALVPSFGPLNERLNAYASRYVFVHVDWGTYSIKALYGPRDQCNIAAWPLDSDEGVQSVRDICRHTGRRPMFIRMRERSGTDLAFLEEQFPGIVPMRLRAGAGSWGVWYEPLYPMFNEGVRRSRPPVPPLQRGLLRRVWTTLRSGI